MPTQAIKNYAKESGKTVAEVEAMWEDCKVTARKKFEKEDSQYWAYVNGCVKRKLGISHVSMEYDKILAWGDRSDE